MENKDLLRLSKFISLILRHKPDVIGIELDTYGWANVDDLINGINKTRYIDFQTLEKIVSEDSKQRYSFNDDKTKIRANQGHSIKVDLELEPIEPPEMLYHGTGSKSVRYIDEDGIKPQSRMYVHLSDSFELAKSVGARHGKAVVYRVLTSKMYNAGYKFYRSKNGVWLTDFIPVDYIQKT